MRVLFAVDLSEPVATVRQVEELTRQLQAELLVLHVHAPAASGPVVPVDPMSGLMGFAPYSVYDPMLEENLERAEEDAFRGFLASRFSMPVLPATRTGDPAEMILQDAEEERADLIALGKRHRTRLQRLLIGSVADEVIRHARRPVLLFPIIGEDE